jgi:hypothetical protein
MEKDSDRPMEKESYLQTVVSTVARATKGRRRQIYAVVFVGACAAAVSVAVTFYTWYQLRLLDVEFARLRVEELKQQIEASQQELVASINQQAERLDRITTHRLNAQVKEVEGKLDELDRQYEALRQIINPSNAEEILNVASMNDEILARKNFEMKIATQVKDVKDTILFVQRFIWGQLAAIIGGLCVVVWRLKHPPK